MHRAEQIVNAVATAVAAQSGLNAEVFTNRTLSFSDEDQELPAACVNMGADQPTLDTGTSNLAYIDSRIGVEIVLYAKASTQAELVTELVRLRTATHKAVMASPRDLSLSFVMEVFYGGAERPEMGTVGSQLCGRLTTTFLIPYRMNLTDPE